MRDDESFEWCPESGGCNIRIPGGVARVGGGLPQRGTAGWHLTRIAIVKVPALRSDEWGWSAF